MASGKSTIGPRIAALVGWTFRDMDRVIEERNGLSVADIFRKHGEPFFREEERRVAEEMSGQEGLVLAAGGGAFASPATREALQRGAATVFLRCELPIILARLGGGRGRPLAASRETIDRLFAERQSSYRLADWTVDASRDAPEDIAREIVGVVFAGRPPGVQGTSDR